MEAVLPAPGIAEIMKEHFVGLAADADAPEREVIELIQTHLADGMMLPFILFTDAEGGYLAGTTGLVRPDDFRKAVEELSQT